MAGYTPLFQSITTGTLCGKWPDIGLWPIVLSLSDQHGIVDVTHQYLSTITGLPLQEVTDCMTRFCEPDPQSRTRDSDGRRLMLVDPERCWGWKIVNHRKYSEKVRLMHKNAREVESGKNKARLSTAADRRSPPQTAPQAQAQSQSQKQRARKRAPADYMPSESLLDGLCAETGYGTPELERMLRMMKDYEFKTAKSDWDAVFRNWVRRERKDEEHKRPDDFGTVHARVRARAGLD